MSRSRIRAALAAMLLIAGLFAPSARAALDSASAERAAEAAARGDWPAAIKEYEILIEQGARDPAVYYNLGTAHGRAGDPGRAVLMLLRARRLAPRDADVRANLAMIAPNLESQIAVLPLAALQFVYGSLSMNEWAWIAGAGTALAAMLFAFNMRAPRGGALRRTVKPVLWTLIALALAAHAMAGLKYGEERLTPLGVVIDARAQPRAAPSDEAEIFQFTLPAGSVLRLESAGVRGWLKASVVGRGEVFLRREQVEYI